MRKDLVVTAVAASFMALGCVPGTYVERPAFHGHVLTADGMVPADTVVNLVEITRETHVATPEAFRVAPDGTFAAADKSHFCFVFAGVDPAARVYRMTAQAGERRSPTIYLYGGGLHAFGIGRSAIEDVGILRLP